jgi:hypothetical protein
MGGEGLPSLPLFPLRTDWMIRSRVPSSSFLKKTEEEEESENDGDKK